MEISHRAPQTRTVWNTYFAPPSWAFWTFHLVAVVAVAATGFSLSGLALAVTAYYVRMFFVTAGYHRYFSHRAFKTSRAFQLFLAFTAQTSAQKGALWWASHHRFHHKNSDTPRDVHSARLRGFWWSHVGWILGPEWNATDMDAVSDLARYPELRFLNHRSVHLLPAFLLAVAFLAIGGVHALIWGFFVSTVMLWHGSFTINSLSHMFGKRRYATTDDSRNNFALALLTTGEGWHNNHHFYQSSANQGFRWWEVDMTYYGLKLLSWIGLVWDLRRPPRAVIDAPAPSEAWQPPADQASQAA